MRKLFGLERYQAVGGIVVLLMGIAAVAILYYWVSIAGHGELGKKEGYSILQSVEIENRNDADRTTPIIKRNVSNSGYDVIGLPTFDTKFPRTWIVLNKTPPNGKILMLPADLNFQIDCAYVAALPTKGEINPVVFSFLTGGCKR